MHSQKQAFRIVSKNEDVEMRSIEVKILENAFSLKETLRNTLLNYENALRSVFS